MDQMVGGEQEAYTPVGILAHWCLRFDPSRMPVFESPCMLFGSCQLFPVYLALSLR
eukprot:m.149915 g.149915  ORF g.149915 m.149915 type:complete len:56 (+) comp14212_c0_seq1:49-216(+)